MRISSINNVYVKSQNNVRRAQAIKTEKAVDIKVQPEENINFKGKILKGAFYGSILGLFIMPNNIFEGKKLLIPTYTTIAGALIGSLFQDNDDNDNNEIKNNSRGYSGCLF